MHQFLNQSIATVLEKASGQLHKKLPFVVYNKPNSDTLIGIFQKNATLHLVEDYNERGFVFAPFNGNKIICIPEKDSEIVLSEFKAIDDYKSVAILAEKEDSEAKERYESIIQKAIVAIQSGNLSKVVLSRKEILKVSNFDFILVLQRLLHSYPSAFSYCFYHPQIGLWLGAFSEQLLKVEDTFFYTSAVAGTQLFEENKEVVWQTKEQQEQEFVSDFIIEKLNNSASEIKISKPYTLKAGNLLHIKTDIEGKLNSNSNLKQVLEILHPTPAVCGLPLDKAKDFILNHESYDREYYSGFLGELNTDFSNQKNATDLYVNLRCVKLDLVSQSESIDAHLFVGGGITKDSIPEKEWNETVNKSQTIKKILDLAF